MASVLIVVTSNSVLGSTDKKTGLWLEEFTTPYYALIDAGVRVTIASPAGGAAPIDPSSEGDGAATDSTRRFKSDPAAIAALAATVPLSSVRLDDFAALFYPGGHGPLWDLASSAESIALIEAAIAAGKPVATVCHGPAVLLKATGAVKGRRVTGFSNSEEAAVGLTSVVPFSLEDSLIAAGGIYSRVGDWAPHFEVDSGLVVTGQNPASSGAVVNALLGLLRRE